MVHPHPRATSTKYSLYYLGQVVTAQSFNDPYPAQDKISTQLARSSFPGYIQALSLLTLSALSTIIACIEYITHRALTVTQTSDHIDPTYALSHRLDMASSYMA
jgi:hypothetical protein